MPKESQEPIDYIAEVDRAAVRRLFGAKMRLTAFLMALGGFAVDESDTRRGRAPHTAEGRAAYNLLYGHLALELVDAYREAFMAGTVAKDVELQRECLEWFCGQRSNIWHMLDMHPGLDRASEADFRSQLRLAMENL